MHVIIGNISLKNMTLKSIFHSLCEYYRKFGMNFKIFFNSMWTSHRNCELWAESERRYGILGMPTLACPLLWLIIQWKVNAQHPWISYCWFLQNFTHQNRKQVNQPRLCLVAQTNYQASLENGNFWKMICETNLFWLNSLCLTGTAKLWTLQETRNWQLKCGTVFIDKEREFRLSDELFQEYHVQIKRKTDKFEGL